MNVSPVNFCAATKLKVKTSGAKEESSKPSYADSLAAIKDAIDENTKAVCANTDKICENTKAVWSNTGKVRGVLNTLDPYHF